MNAEFAERHRVYMASPEWATLRLRVLDRQGRACQRCLSPMRLHVHHMTYARFGHERFEDLIVLCEQCHDLVHRTSRAQPERTLMDVTLEVVRGVHRPAA